MPTRMIKITHGKNGVEELPVIPCTQDFHEGIKDSDARWADEVENKKIWPIDETETLYVGQCKYCGSVIARLFDLKVN